MMCVESLNDVTSCRIIFPIELIWTLKVFWRTCCTEVGALKCCWQKTISKVVFSTACETARIINCNKCRKVFVLGAECVGCPCTKRWKAFHCEPGVHEVLTLRMSARLGVEGVNEAEFICLFGQVGEKVRHHLAGLSTRPKFPERLRNVSSRSFKGDVWNSRGLLPMELFKFWLVVECVYMADSAGAVDDENLFRRHWEVR